jgi:hypothetical protein
MPQYEAGRGCHSFQNQNHGGTVSVPFSYLNASYPGPIRVSCQWRRRGTRAKSVECYLKQRQPFYFFLQLESFQLPILSDKKGARDMFQLTRSEFTTPLQPLYTNTLLVRRLPISALYSYFSSLKEEPCDYIMSWQISQHGQTRARTYKYLSTSQPLQNRSAF